MARLAAVLVLLVACDAAELFAPDDFPGFGDLTRRRPFSKKHRPIYHITAPAGWVNDPTGFVKFRNQYHLFYLYHPYTGSWGHISWAHVVTDTLVDWMHYPAALAPKERYERHGCLGGSALVHNDYLTLFYTGNVIANNRTMQSQNIAISSDGIVFQKYLYNPIIKESPYKDNGDFRNPKVWRFHNSWYMLVGAMSPEKHGQLLMYSSPDMFHWKLNGTVARSYGDMGYMWENPDLFELGSFHVLMFCARGVQTDGFRFRNLHQAGYLIGKFDYITGQFKDEFEVSTDTYNVLDYGHDFYAPRTLLDSDGRRLMVGWLGMWESNFEESNEGWASLLTIVRELTLDKDAKLLIVPSKEIAELRSEVLEDAWYSPGESFYAGSKAFELIVNSTADANNVRVSLEWEEQGRFTIEYDAAHGFVAIDRGGEDGARRADWAPPGDLVYWRIFFDFSAIEIFCGKGEVVFSSRIYPKKAVNIKIGGDTPLHMLQYSLRRSVFHDEYTQLQSPAQAWAQELSNSHHPNSLNRRKRRLKDSSIRSATPRFEV